MIDTVRISEKGKHQLISLKRRTGIGNWNTLCRWAFCLSLSEKTEPPQENIQDYSSIEMTWKTFGGVYEDVYLALLVNRAKKAGVNLDKHAVNQYFKLHVHRGISYLTGNPNLKSISNLIELSC